MVNKLSIVFAIVLVVAFIVLAFKSIGQQILGTQGILKIQTTNENTNTKNDELLIPPPPSSLDSLNELINGSQQGTPTQTIGENLSTFCTDEIEKVQSQDWYQKFYTLYTKREPGTVYVPGEIRQICVTDSFKKIVFIKHYEDNGEQIDLYTENNGKGEIMHPEELYFQQTSAPTNTNAASNKTNYYSLSGWINENTFVFSTADETTKNYFVFDLSTRLNKIINTCTLQTQTLICGPSEHEAWGCPLGETTTQTVENCSETN